MQRRTCLAGEVLHASDARVAERGVQLGGQPCEQVCEALPRPGQPARLLPVPGVDVGAVRTVLHNPARVPAPPTWPCVQTACLSGCVSLRGRQCRASQPRRPSSLQPVQGVDASANSALLLVQRTTRSSYSATRGEQPRQRCTDYKIWLQLSACNGLARRDQHG